MIQRRHFPQPVLQNRTWVTSDTMAGRDVDRGPGPVGIMPKHTPGGVLVSDAQSRPKR